MSLSDPSGGAPALAALRAATARHHDALDALLHLQDGCDRPRYVRLLQGFEAFVRDWEPLMVRALGPSRLPRWAGGRSVALLQADLRALGAAPLPWAAPMPCLDTPARALGSLYVLEGSALGGQVLAPALRLRPGVDAATGGAWFHGLGGASGARWRAIRDWLGQELDPAPLATAQAADAAAATFACLHATFHALLDAPARPASRPDDAHDPAAAPA
jgi:heme oxygenase